MGRKRRKNNAYFLGLEKSRQSKKVIKKILLDDGRYLESNEAICEEINKFYSKLYTSENVDQNTITQYLENTNVDTCLTGEDKKICDGLLNKDECEKAVFKMKKIVALVATEFLWSSIKNFGKYLRLML